MNENSMVESGSGSSDGVTGGIRARQCQAITIVWGKDTEETLGSQSGCTGCDIFSQKMTSLFVVISGNKTRNFSGCPLLFSFYSAYSIYKIYDKNWKNDRINDISGANKIQIKIINCITTKIKRIIENKK